jgi:hypothetical protein
MLKYECYLFVLAVDFLFKLIVCRFLYVEISCLNPNPKDGGCQIIGNGELFIVFGYGCVSGTFPSAIRTILVIPVRC